MENFFVNKKIKSIINHSTSLKDDILWFLNNNDSEIINLLFNKANEIRNIYCGNFFAVRGLIEFSSFCKNTCLYCGLNCNNKNASRYKLSKNEILNSVEKIYLSNIKTVVLQSGEDNSSTEFITDIIKTIKSFFPDIAITLSVGERSFEDFKTWKEAGASRYLLRIETTNANLYKQIHLNRTVESRLACLKNLQTLEYQTGSGLMIGFPGQTLNDIANDLIFFAENNFDMIGIGPFIPHPETPFKNDKTGFVDLTLKTIALTRLLLKDIWIPATTALGSMEKDFRIDALLCGANVIMPNFSPDIYKEKYNIYPGKVCISENKKNAIQLLEKLSQESGLHISYEINDRIK